MILYQFEIEITTFLRLAEDVAHSYIAHHWNATIENAEHAPNNASLRCLCMILCQFVIIIFLHFDENAAFPRIFRRWNAITSNSEHTLLKRICGFV